MNFFVLQMKLVAKERVGARVCKRYDTAATPYARLLALGALDARTMARLEDLYLALNPAELRRRLTDNERKLVRLCALEEQVGRKEVAATA